MRILEYVSVKMIELLKQKLFSSEAAQAALLAKIDDASDVDDALQKLFFEYKEDDLQKILAPFLRAATINHMRQATTIWAQNSRRVQIQELGERQVLANLRSENPRRQQKCLIQDEQQSHQFAINVFGEISFEEYLQHQAQDTIWSEDIDAANLADLLDITMIATPVSIDHEGNYKEHLTYRVYECSPERPSIHCYNADGAHWFFYPKGYHETIGDGNCLYNTFAQSLRQIILLEVRHSDEEELKQSISKHLSKKYLAKYAEQERLLQKTHQNNITTLTQGELAKKITSRDGVKSNELQPTQNKTLLQEIIARLKKEYLLEIKRHALSAQQQLIVRGLRDESLCIHNFLQQADSLQLKNNPLPTILKCIKTLHLPQSSSNITEQELNELSNALTNVENAAPLYKQWHQFVSLIKQFVAKIGGLLGQNWSSDTTYRGPIRNQFWAESKEIGTIVDYTSSANNQPPIHNLIAGM